MHKKQVRLFKCYMINDNENQTENEKQITQIRHKIDLDQDMDTNVLNINCVSTFEAQFIKKLSNTEAELKKSVAYQKNRVTIRETPIFKVKLKIRISSRLSVLQYFVHSFLYIRIANLFPIISRNLLNRATIALPITNGFQSHYKSND